MNTPLVTAKFSFSYDSGKEPKAYPISKKLITLLKKRKFKLVGSNWIKKETTPMEAYQIGSLLWELIARHGEDQKNIIYDFHFGMNFPANDSRI